MFNTLYSARKLFQPKWENYCDWILEEKACRTFDGYIWYFKLNNYINSVGFWEVLEQIGALEKNIEIHNFHIFSAKKVLKWTTIK